MTKQRSFDPIKLAAGKRILQSSRALQFLEARVLHGLEDHPANRVVAQFGMDLLRKLYADPSSKIVWSNVFFPSELLWGLGVVPFFPEIGAAVGTGIGFADSALERATAEAYAVDLCTFQRALAGLALGGIFPRADAIVSVSHLCDASGQNLANHAYQSSCPFFFVDIPASNDQAAVEYVARQLEATAHALCHTVGVTFDLDRIRQAICLSNLAWDAAREQLALRASRPAPLRGSNMIAQIGLTVMLFGTSFGVKYHRALRDYVQERVTTHTPEQASQKLRLYWMHLRPYFTTDLMSHLEDELGAVIAFEEMSSIWWERLDEERPLESLARKMLANFSLGPVERRIDKALANIARYQCDGAIHFSHWGCHQSTGGLRLIRDRLKREGIPFLAIDGDCVDATNLPMGPLRTRIEAFVETLAT
jgi:benzoyl-CoA reductase/2-hydroxyglutaryl-CoA dehydratase subunit BcrC/BadD/HgdB